MVAKIRILFQILHEIKTEELGRIRQNIPFTEFLSKIHSF